MKMNDARVRGISACLEMADEAKRAYRRHVASARALLHVQISRRRRHAYGPAAIFSAQESIVTLIDADRSATQYTGVYQIDSTASLR